jgi:hypothetical protein
MVSSFRERRALRKVLVHNAGTVGVSDCFIIRRTMADRLEDFQKFRTDLNEEILGCGHLGIKRFFARKAGNARK